MSESVLSLQNVSIWYPIRKGILNKIRGYIHAVNNVSLELHRGETLGLVGESGCGKSTLGRGIIGLEKLHNGKIFLDSTCISALKERQMRPLRKRIQMIFQDPFSSLNPRMTVMELLTEGLIIHGMMNGRSSLEAAEEIMTEIGLSPDTMYRYPHEFSGGQRQRIAIARAVFLHPDFIVCDEPVSALDVSVQAQILNLLIDLRRKYSLSYLFISHNLNVVHQISDRVAVMYLGNIVETGTTHEVMESPLHPYTRALISSVPQIGSSRQKSRIVLQGEMPSPLNPPSGCPFHPRCPFASPECESITPDLSAVNDSATHFSSCIRGAQKN